MLGSQIRALSKVSLEVVEFVDLIAFVIDRIAVEKRIGLRYFHFSWRTPALWK